MGAISPEVKAEFIKDIADALSFLEPDIALQIAETIVESPKIQASILAASGIEDLYKRLREL